MMMHFQSLTLLSILGASSAANSNALRDNTHGRDLQVAIACLATPGATIEGCCAATPDDAVCTILTCVDVVDIAGNMIQNQACSCGQIEAACAGVIPFEAALPALKGLSDMCVEVNACCVADETPNDAFNTCVAGKLDGMALPNFAAILPAGLLPGTGGLEPQSGMGDMCSFCPDGLTMPKETTLPAAGTTCETAMGYAASLQAGDAMCATAQMGEALCCPTGEMPVTDVVSDTATPTTEAPPAAADTTTVATEAPATEAADTTTVATEAPATDGVEVADDSSASMYAVGTLMSLTASSLAMIFV